MRQRRAISSVVGTVFAIIALTTTITYVSYSMGILNNYNQSVITRNQQLADVSGEKFQISGVTIPSNGNLNVTVANTGSLPIKFTKVWIQNTSTTDWTHNYTPTNNFVSPGAILTNLGQNIPVKINTANSYNIKLVTSRGNAQQFTMNSPNAVPLNIQMMFLPPTISDGFTTELIMIVSNNSTGVLTNLSVSPLPAPTGSASNYCTAGPVSPSKYTSLPPGDSAVFKWDVSVALGAGDGWTCTYGYTSTPPLQNGYLQTVSAKVTVTQVKFASTILSQNTGILTLNYTTFRWTEGGQWHSGWAPPGSNNVAFTVNMTNNNMTASNTNFYISKNSLAFILNAGGSTVNTSYYIVNATTLSPLGATGYSCTGPPSNDYCLSVPPGGTVKLYFYASNPGSPTQLNSNKLPGTNTPLTFTLVMFGKYATSQSGTGTLYGQSLPYVGLVTS